MMNLRLGISGLMIVFVSAACNQSTEKGDRTAVDSTSIKAALPADIKNKNTQQVYDDYLKLKDELVSSDSSKAQSAAKELASSLAKIDGCENTSALAIKITEAADLKTQRTHFTALSSDIVALVKHTELNSGSLFVQFCPMANEGAGGYWLSAEKEIRNPYYGDEMMDCGEVKETIAAVKN